MGGGGSFGDTPVTLIILAATVLVSWQASNNRQLRDRLLMNPYLVKHSGQYYRIFGHALIHADFMHLFFNMYVFYEFGSILEQVFTDQITFNLVLPGVDFWGVWAGRLYFLTLYIGGVLFATLPSLKKHGDNPSYNSLGASGAVSAVLIGFIVLFPVSELSLLILPFVGIPAFIMGLLFFAYESYMNRKGRTGIAHDAHLVGALFGLIFMMVINKAFLARMISEIGMYFGS